MQLRCDKLIHKAWNKGLFYHEMTKQTALDRQSTVECTYCALAPRGSCRSITSSSAVDNVLQDSYFSHKSDEQGTAVNVDKAAKDYSLYPSHFIC